MKYMYFIGMLLFVNSCNSQESIKNVVEKGMTVNWYYSAESIYFEMTAPTKGWIAIGFNTTSELKNTYLLMGNIINDKPNVKEHYVVAAGNYKAFEELKQIKNVQNVKGKEDRHNTKLSFSIPIQEIAPYKPSFALGKEYVLLLAYSQEDNFQHHSIMRTSKKIKL